MKLGRALLLVLLLNLPAIATVYNMKIVSVAEPPVTSERIFFDLFNDFNSSIQQASFTLPLDASDIKVEDNYGQLGFDEKKADSVQLLYNFTSPINPGGRRSIIIEYSTQQTLRKLDSEWEFLMAFVPTSGIEVEHLLEIPREFDVSGGRRTLISPEAEVSSKEGKTVVTWRVLGTKDQPLVFIARFSQKQAGFNWMYSVLGLVAVFAVLVFGILTKKGMKELRKKKMMAVLKVVRDEDRGVLELIVKNPGINQNDIVKNLGVSKASISKRVNNLIMQNFVKKDRRGKKNYLFPGDKLSK